LPVIRQSPSGPSLVFRQWSGATEMEKSRFGIPEPCRSPEIPLSDIDLLLMPLVGWDESGNRLGMGAGFYDRALAPLSQSDSPIRAGVAYQLQKVPVMPLDPWDIRLHMLLSETGWFSCPKKFTQ
jgi:5-formyltetrahydrofolate cyclo-ligase